MVWKEAGTPAPNIRDAWLSDLFGPGWGGSPSEFGVAPSNPDICYGTDSGRTMRTIDGGKTWTGIYSKRQPDGNYATSGLDVTTSYGVHFDPFDLKRMFISYTDIGLFRSENGGKSWPGATQGVPRQWRNTTYWITFDPEIRGRVWGAMAVAQTCRVQDVARDADCEISGRGVPKRRWRQVLDPVQQRDAGDGNHPHPGRSEEPEGRSSAVRHRMRDGCV